jgi:hypothetical protein
MAGRVVYKAVRYNPEKVEKMDLGKFPAGFYMVRIASGDLAKTIKLILID